MGTAEVTHSAEGEAQRIYGDHAPYLRELGYCPIPLDGKSPLRRGFNKWKYNQKQATIDGWAKRDPYANVGLVTGLCKTGYDCDLVVADCDDEEAIGQGVDLFGETPGKVRTFHGRHGWFKKRKSLDLGKVHSLRPYGYNIDLKHGQLQAAIVVAPPSVNAKHDNFPYTWEDCDPTVIRDLPWLPEKKLFDVLNKGLPSEEERTQKNVEALLRDGSRHLTLNDVMCGMGGYYIRDDLNGFYDEGRRQNPRVAQVTGKPELSDFDVVEVCNAVWYDFKRGNLTPYHRTRGRANMADEEIDLLTEIDSDHAGDAFMMLARLRNKHSARCKRGETFVICPDAMARDGTIKGWSRKKIERARDLLIEAGLILRVIDFERRYGKGRAAQYTFNVQEPNLKANRSAGGGAARGQYQVTLSSILDG